MKMGETPRSTAVPEKHITSNMFDKFPALFEAGTPSLCSLYVAIATYPEPVHPHALFC
jgi:hypothetical protein